MNSDNLKPLDRNSWPTLVADHVARMISKMTKWDQLPARREPPPTK